MKSITTFFNLKHLYQKLIFAILALVVVPVAIADDGGLPLDDPWIMFCLLHEPVEDVGSCIDAIPAVSIRNTFKHSGYTFEYQPVLKVVKKEDNQRLDLTSGKPKDEDVYLSFICPNEFGAACNDLIEAVLAFGGSCKHVPNNTVCELPD